MKEKAILVISMPKSCEKCDYRFIGNDNSSYCGLTKTFMNRKTDVTKEIDVCCPLRPMPERKEVHYTDPLFGEVENLTNIGYNKCLDDLGETE